MLGIARTLTFWHSESITRIGERKSIILALMIQAFSLIAMAYFYGFIHFLIPMSLIGFSIGILTPLSLSIASKKASSERAGITMGIVEGIFGMGWTIGPIVEGATANP